MNTALLRKIALRIFSSVIVLFLVVSFVFIIINIAPGNPAQKYLSHKISTSLYEGVKESFKLNEPVYTRYIAFVKNIVAGNFGVSYTYRKPVLSVISDYLPFTIIFSLLSFLIQLFLSFLLVYIVVKNKSKIVEKTISNTLLTLYSTPLFLLSVLLIYLFSFKLQIFPSTGFYSYSSYNLPFFEKMLDYFNHLFLPIVASSFVGIPIYYRYLLTSVRKSLGSHFIINLKINGVSDRVIFLKHIIKNSTNTVVAIAGIELGILLGGSVLVETIFGLPGMGRLTMNAVASRDYPLIAGAILVAGILILLANLIADIIRIIIDKRLLKGELS